jgi:hypothetical protein
LGEHVVVERSLQDRRVDQTGDVLERTQVRRLDHRLHPATGRDNLGGDLVTSAVQVRSSGRPAGVTLVQKSPVAAARTASARRALGRDLPCATGILTLPPSLLLRLLAHLPVKPLLLHAPLRGDSLRQPQPLHSLLELFRNIRPFEIVAERRVLNVVVGSERPQRLTGRPAPNQLRIGNEPPQSTLTLHANGF